MISKCLILNNALSKLGKECGFDGIFNEFLRPLKVKCRKWLVAFFNDILHKGRIPKEFKKFKVLAIVKPEKEGSDSSHYRSIYLLSVTYKLFKRLLLNRLGPKIDESLPKEQAGFR